MTEDTIKQIAQRFGAIYEDRIVFHDDKFTEFAEAVVAALESRVLAESDKQEAVAQVVPYLTPSGKRVALDTKYQDLPVGTKLYAHPIASADVLDLLEDALDYVEAFKSDKEDGHIAEELANKITAAIAANRATEEACAHDYKRSDGVCIECGESSASEEGEKS